MRRVAAGSAVLSLLLTGVLAAQTMPQLFQKAKEQVKS